MNSAQTTLRNTAMQTVPCVRHYPMKYELPHTKTVTLLFKFSFLEFLQLPWFSEVGLLQKARGGMRYWYFFDSYLKYIIWTILYSINSFINSKFSFSIMLDYHFLSQMKARISGNSKRKQEWKQVFLPHVEYYFHFYSHMYLQSVKLRLPEALPTYSTSTTEAEQFLREITAKRYFSIKGESIP